MTLQQGVLHVALGIFELATTASFCISLLSGIATETISDNDRPIFLPFFIAWISSILVVLYFSVDEANKEWYIKTHPRIGDITLQPKRVFSWRTYTALVSFFFFGLETTIRDIVITLHPWKGVQPYAAVKFEGTRAYVLGYDSHAHFLIWKMAGQQRVLLAKLGASLAIVLFKISMLINSGTSDRLLGMWNVGCSMVSLVTIFLTWMRVHCARRKFRAMHPEAFGPSPRQAQPEPEVSDGDMHTKSPNEEQVQWRERAWVMEHFSSARDVRKDIWKKEDQTCTGCRREFGTFDMAAVNNAVVHANGGFVTLAENFTAFTDARFGPLKSGDIGKVLSVGRLGRGHGRRVLVSPWPDTGGGGQTGWWYDAGAVRSCAGISGPAGPSGALGVLAPQCPRRVLPPPPAEPEECTPILVTMPLAPGDPRLCHALTRTPSDAFMEPLADWGEFEERVREIGVRLGSQVSTIEACEAATAFLREKVYPLLWREIPDIVRVSDRRISEDFCPTLTTPMHNAALDAMVNGSFSPDAETQADADVLLEGHAPHAGESSPEGNDPPRAQELSQNSFDIIPVSVAAKRLIITMDL